MTVRPAPLEDGPGRLRWVLLETSGNQSYIFDANRRRLGVGASQLVHEVGAVWAEEAAAEVGVEAVQATSGKALLLVPDAESGRRVVREMTRRALDQAPGLDVMGVVGPAFPADAVYSLHHDAAETVEWNHVSALQSTYVLHRRLRSRGARQHLRDQLMPWHDVCPDTGGPVAGSITYGDDGPVPASWEALCKDSASRRAVERLRSRLPLSLSAHKDLLPPRLDVESSSGWVSVVHADGNGVGRLFESFPRWVCAALGEDALDLTTHREQLSAATAHLERLTAESVDAALLQALAATGHPSAGSVLPVVLGGDDVTLVCHAVLARPFAEAFMRELEERTSHCAQLAQLLAADPTARRGPHRGLTAAAGISYVKPHHPFSTAYQAAEQLTAAAKSALRTEPDQGVVGAYDFHVSHDSTLRSLADLRDETVLHHGTRRHAGPYLVTTRGQGAEESSRSSAHLDKLLTILDDRRMSGRQAHDLRQAADQSLAEYDAALQRALRLLPPGRAAREAEELLSEVALDDGSTFLRLPDALLLRGAERATRSELVR